MQVPFLDLKRQYELLKDEIDPAVQAVMADQAFIGGKYVRDFEEQIAHFLGVKRLCWRCVPVI